MIRCLTQEEIDKEKWNEAVLQASNGLVYALSWYLDIVSPGWGALIEDDYRMVFPLPVKRKYGIRYLIQPPFVQQLGLFGRPAPEEEEVARFVEHIPPQYRYVDIQLNERNPAPKIAEKIIQRRNILLDLNKTGRLPEKYYHENTSRNIKKFKKNGLIVTEDPLSAYDIIRLFAAEQGKLYGTSKDHYNRLAGLLQVILERELGEILVVRQEELLLAGAVFIKSFDRYIFLFSANSRVGREVQALTGIMDHFIRKHAGEKLLLDFEGSDNDNLARFYRGFGGYEKFYNRVVINRLPWLIRRLKKI